MRLIGHKNGAPGFLRWVPLFFCLGGVLLCRVYKCPMSQMAVCPFFHGRIHGRIVRFRSFRQFRLFRPYASDLRIYFRQFRQFRQDMPKNGISSSINRSAVLWAALLLLGRGYAAHCMRV